MIDLYTKEEIHNLVDVLLLSGINWDSLNYLKFLDSLKMDEDFSIIIQVKLLWVISYVFSKRLYFFRIYQETKERNKEDLVGFKQKLVKIMKKAVVDQETLCICLSCLSNFEFGDFMDQMVTKSG